MASDPHNTTLRDLHRSLDERWRPENVAQAILGLIDLQRSERRVVEQAASAGRKNFWFTMSRDFHRPADMQRQLKVAEELFGRKVTFAPDDLLPIETWVEAIERTIGKQLGRNDFKYDRMTSGQRRTAGIEMSRRQYNKRFRLVMRMERKMLRIAREKFKRSLVLASKSRLASRISWDDFSADLNSACFIAYFVARANLRSIFTNTSQVRAYDEICETLMDRCLRSPGTTNWWAIAQAMPTREVLGHLDDEQKGVLLGDYFNVLNDAAMLLKELWESSGGFDEKMIVRRGNDSTTWNVTAGAWNKLRDGWFSLMYSLGMIDGVEQMCPGKVLRLIAADVARWHEASGGGVHPDTLVWKELPRPWEVITGEASCPKSLVDEICVRHGIKPEDSAWSAPRPEGYLEKFTPTPELVHGVVVSSPLLAMVLRKAGVFSGRPTTGFVPTAAVDEIRSRHYRAQMQPTTEIEGSSEDVSAV